MSRARGLHLHHGIDVSDTDMEKGHFLCNTNVSLWRKGESKLGTRTELENLDSFHRGEERASGCRCS